MTERITKIQGRIKNISDIWMRYFLEYKACNSEINFTEEIQNNYLADVFIYLRDTLEFMNEAGNTNDAMKNVFNAIGVLQTLYTHQDLIDELLIVFKMQKSSGDYKKINRDIRNELIGHPIRRRNNQFISSVFFGRGFSNSEIKYVLYKNESRFQGKTMTFAWADILARHFDFLDHYLDLIWKRIFKILKDFQKKLIGFSSLIDTIPFEKVIDLAEHRFEIIFRHNEAYTKEFLLECEQKRLEHERYGFLKKLFKQELKDCVNETIECLNEIINPGAKTATEPELELPFFEFCEVTDPSEIIDEEFSRFNTVFDLGYEFSKLYEDHDVGGIKYFMENYGEDPVIMAELKIMKKHKDTPLFACAFEYLKFYMTGSSE
ncbi:hypothetical protein DBR43_09670 [Pedobacter sp. KBW06]|uniref:hypothetical protein n=1 Tax=Pedobacter sp. KBW06 TaxID=2153359 RepID=UPI000F5B2AFD|nr:hypothetical protein [Pedobacter sp. KBW06]RQO75595.1 hypothetical protein DBR43_09670 [Pedobacter sp. KBW06]